MIKIMKFALSLLLALAVTTMPAMFAEAAPPQSDLATLKLKVEVAEKQFWDCAFYAKDADPSKPSVIKAEWSFGNMGKNTKSAVLVPTGKLAGEVSITSEKGSLVNLDVLVKDAKNKTLGYWGMQLINKGQTETVIIALPEEFRPQFTRSNI